MEKAETNIIAVGAEKTADYLAFGDDSQTENSLIYAFVIIARSRVQTIEWRIAALKERFKIPQNMPLHCRILFSKEAREKKGLSHLNTADARSIVERAINIINKNDIWVRYAFGDLAHIQATFPPDLKMENIEDKSELGFSMNPHPKGILSILMQACFCIPSDGSKGPSLNQCEIFASEDSTPINFIGTGRKRADRHYSGFSDVGAPEGMVFQLQPNIVKANANPMVQLADIAAYVCSHAVRNGEKDYFFKEQLSRVKLWTNAGPLLSSTEPFPGILKHPPQF